MNTLSHGSKFHILDLKEGSMPNLQQSQSLSPSPLQKPHYEIKVDAGNLICVVGNDYTSGENIQGGFKDVISPHLTGDVTNVTLDLCNLTFVSAQEISEIIALNKLLKQSNKGLSLINVLQPPYEAFQIKRLDKLFSIS